MLLDLLFSGNIKETLIVFLMWVPVILLAFSVHESAHALVASWLGDRTARNFGRVTLNPAKHLDPYGTLSMLVFGIGWAKPVPINSRNMKNPKWGMAISALAGPVSNLLLGFIFIIGMSIACKSVDVSYINNTFYYWPDAPAWHLYLCQFFYYAAVLNISLAVFNMIPFPPFDGSRILYVVLPMKLYFKVMRYEQYVGIAIMVIFLVLNRIGIDPLFYVVDPIVNLLFSLVGG
jgi:Zn-dependent protease